MRTYRFTYAEHTDYGMWGWRPDWMRGADPLQPMGAVHDILEHGCADGGTIHDEFMASGATIYVRRHYFNIIGSMRPDPSTHIASEFPQQYQYWARDGGFIVHPAMHQRWRNWPSLPIRDEDVEAQILSTVREGLKNMRDELDEENVEPFTYEGIAAWMRIGYRRAIRRFHHHDSYHMSSFFHRLEQEIERLTKRLDEGQPYKMNVSLTTKHLGARIMLQDYDYDRERFRDSELAEI